MTEIHEMQNFEITELLVFLAVARHRSFRRAAIERGMTASAVSHAIKRLETRLELRLIHRTTRSVSLTEPGAHFFAQLEPAFADIHKAIETLNQFRDTPFGTVRINIPHSIAPFVLGKVIGPLVERNPGLQLEIVATDRLVDIVEQGFDAGIRLGERLSQDMVAVRIAARLRFAVVGTPTYFAGRNIPMTPHDLKDHRCIRYRFPSGSMLNWEFERGSENIDVNVEGPVTIDDQELMVETALSGAGLAYVWDYRIERHLQSGALIRCLDDWCAPLDDLFLYYPSRKNVSAGLRALIGALR